MYISRVDSGREKPPGEIALFQHREKLFLAVHGLRARGAHFPSASLEEVPWGAFPAGIGRLPGGLGRSRAPCRRQVRSAPLQMPGKPVNMGKPGAHAAACSAQLSRPQPRSRTRGPRRSLRVQPAPDRPRSWKPARAETGHGAPPSLSEHRGRETRCDCPSRTPAGAPGAGDQDSREPETRRGK